MGKYYCEGTIKTIALSVAPRGEMTITIEPTPSFKVTRSESESYSCLVSENARNTNSEIALKAYRGPVKIVIGIVTLLELLHLKDNKSKLGFKVNLDAPTKPKCAALIVL